MTPGQEIVLDDALRQLRLPAMGREWREHARQAKEAGEGYTGFLLALASRELEQRQANQVQRRLREARFPLLKTLETTDLKKWPALDVVQVRDVTYFAYLDEFGHIGPYVSRADARHNGSPVFGLAGTIIIPISRSQLVSTLAK